MDIKLILRNKTIELQKTFQTKYANHECIMSIISGYYENVCLCIQADQLKMCAFDDYTG